MCPFPDVKYARDNKTTRSAPRMQSRTRIEEGFKDEPGLSRSDKNEDSGVGPSMSE